MVPGIGDPARGPSDLSESVGGCSTRTNPVTVTETVEAPECATDEAKSRVLVAEETTVERALEPSGHRVLSCSFVVAGEAIALPFEEVGAAFRPIF